MENENMDEILAILEPGDYWEWRLTVEEMEHSKTKTENASFKYKILELTTQLNSMQLQSLKAAYQQSSAVQLEVKKNYDLQIKKIEEKYEIDLKGCIIGDIDYEVTRPA